MHLCIIALKTKGKNVNFRTVATLQRRRSKIEERGGGEFQESFKEGLER